MILQFRTATTATGHCKYVCFDTHSEEFSKHPSTYVSSDIPTLKAKDYKELIEHLQLCQFKEVERVW